MSNARSTAIRSADKPTGVSLNLDTLQREVTVDPFVVVIGGKRRVFADPDEMIWQDLTQALQDPSGEALFRLTLDPDDYAEVMALPGWKIKHLVPAYMEHYGLDAGNPDASPT